MILAEERTAMTPLNVVILDRASLVNRPFEFDFPHQLAEYDHTDAADTAVRLKGADIVVSNKVVITAEHIADNPQLKLIAVAATGYNNIDLTAAKAAGITVCNIRAYGNESVAEHAFMLIIALMRNLPAYQRDVAAGLWQNSPFFCHFGAPMRDLNGKILGIFGKGNIGQTLASRAEAFGMKVCYGEHKHAAHVRPGYTAFNELIQIADVISLHCPLTETTANMIGLPELQSMKAGAILINVSRGGLVDEQALVAALKYGMLGGAGIDVLTEEPPRQGNPLLSARLPHLIVTPHMAWGSSEAQNRLFDILTTNINAYVRGQAQNIL